MISLLEMRRGGFLPALLSPIVGCNQKEAGKMSASFWLQHTLHINDLQMAAIVRNY